MILILLQAAAPAVESGWKIEPSMVLQLVVFVFAAGGVYARLGNVMERVKRIEGFFDRSITDDFVERVGRPGGRNKDEGS